MNASTNKVLLVGFLGLAPEVKNTENGRKLARFSMATNEIYRNSKGENVTETQWHNLIAWGKMAEIAEKASKGAQVSVVGKLVSNSYLDKEGKKRYSTQVVVNEMELLGEKSPA